MTPQPTERQMGVTVTRERNEPWCYLVICDECKETIERVARLPATRVTVEAHAREKHGFTAIRDITQTFEVICPPMYGFQVSGERR